MLGLFKVGHHALDRGIERRLVCIVATQRQPLDSFRSIKMFEHRVMQPSRRQWVELLAAFAGRANSSTRRAKNKNGQRA